MNSSYVAKRFFFPLVLILFSLPGCVVLVGPGWYRPPPAQPVYYPAPPCPAGFVWVPGSGCAPAAAAPPQNAPPQNAPPQSPVYAMVTAAYLNVRACPGEQCEVVTTLGRDQMVQILEVKEGWTRIWSPDMRLEGWVLGKFLGPA